MRHQNQSFPIFLHRAVLTKMGEWYPIQENEELSQFICLRQGYKLSIIQAI